MADKRDYYEVLGVDKGAAYGVLVVFDFLELGD